MLEMVLALCVAKQGKIELSTNEAMQIAMAKKQMIDYEKRLKDLFLISGNHETYNHMKKLQRDSIARARKRAAKAKAKKKARKAEIKEAALVLPALGKTLREPILRTFDTSAVFRLLLSARL